MASSVATAAPDVFVRAHTPQHRIAEWEDVCLFMWMNGVTLEGLAAARESHLAVAERYGKACSITYARTGSPLPAPGARQEAARLMREVASTQAYSIVVLEGNGFWASAARGAITAIQVLSMNIYPLRVSSSIPAGTQLLAERTGRSHAWAGELQAAVLNVLG